MDGLRSSDAAGTETRFQTLFEQAPFSLQLIAADGRTLRVNKAWQDLWQIRDGDRGLNFVLTEYNILEDPQLIASGVVGCLRRAFAGEPVTTPPTAYDPTAIGQPGRERWIVAHFHPIRDAQGDVPEVMLIHEDVTERISAENELRASELRLKQLANTIPQLAWIADAQGNIYWFNDRWYAYTGTTPAQMADGGWASVHDPSTVASVLEFWRRTIAQGESVHLTFPLRGHDGVYRPFFTRVAPLKDASGTVMQWFGTNTDVSPLRDAERELRQTEERLRLATDAGNIGIWEWHLDQDLVTWSDKVYQLHGMAPGDFGGRAADFQELVHPADLPMLWSRVESAVRNRDGFTADFRVLLPAGGERWLSTWARVHRESSGTDDVRLIGATISIDDYKRAEAALKDSDRRKDEFLAMLAHELRNPLAPISSAAELLKRASGDARIVQHAGEVIARQVRHMTELVDDLLDVSRVTRGLVQLEMAPVDLNTIVTSAIEQVRPLIEARQHVVTTWSGAGRTWVRADRTRLVQVVGNLLNNAAKYTPPGGRIDVRVEVHGREAHVVVRDDGIGIEPNLLPHVFELFAQGERTPDRAQGGLGIGLALVKSIVALHGGTVEAISRGPGTGSTFRVELPVVDDAQVSVHAPAAGASTVTRSRHVVVVDDNVDAADTLAAVLAAAGHEVRVFHDAGGLLAAELPAPPHLFVLDIGLPDLDGYELARRLRLRPEYRDAIFVALTGYGQVGDRERSRDAGFHHHFVKPVESGAFERLLADVG